MTLSFAVSDRFREAAAEWSDRRLTDESAALETKVEQALLEIEHLVSGATEVEFAIEDGVVRYEPSEDLATLLEEQAAAADLDPGVLLGLHVDLFARVFLAEDDPAAGHHPDDPRP